MAAVASSQALSMSAAAVCVDGAPGSPGRDSSNSPTREVAVRVLHMRSQPLGVASRSLAQGLDGARRLDALEWLVQAFDALNLPDNQLFAAFGLLDRFAAASPAPISAGPGAFALVLAAMLVALKATGTQRELERAKRLVAEVSGTSRPWAAVRKAELCILRRLSFRACTPTSRDLLDRLLGEASTLRLSQEDSAWDADAQSRCADLARFLLELGLVHEPETLYGPGHPPLAAALASLLLALLALGAPRPCAEALREPAWLLDGKLAVAELAEAMRQRWANEERRAAGGGGGSAVLEKWLRRVGSFGASPPAAADLRFLMAAVGIVADTPVASAQKPVQEPARAKPSPPTAARRSSMGVVQVLATLPTPARRASGLSAAAPAEGASEQKQVLQPQLQQPELQPAPMPRTLAMRPVLGVADEASQHLPTPRPALGAVGTGAPAVAPLSPPPQEQRNVQVHVAGSTAAASPEERQLAERPLVELTHVLNMVASRPAQSVLASQPGAAGSKQKPPSVAAELLISSALRMQWPHDRRKVATADAAGTCREAAEVLKEAAAQLLGAAAALDGGACPSAKIFPPGPGSESKRRRRTFGGPSPARAVSPVGGGGHAMQRGSPSVRFSGLRV